MRSFGVMALTAPGLLDPSIAIAASRAGAFGILDLEYLSEQHAARAALARLVRFGRGDLGVKITGELDPRVTDVIAGLPNEITVVVLTAGEAESLHQEVETLRRRGGTILLEVSCLEQALLGEALGVDGLIAKGHEAGGRVGEETTFVLLQRLLAKVSLPVWAQGGIGLHTAAACYAAGAAGVVLDGQLALTRESPLAKTVRDLIARLDGSETIILGAELGEAYRLYARPSLPVVEELRQTVKTLEQDPRHRADILDAWRQAIRERIGWGPPERNLWLLGQDAAFAADLAQRFHTVGGIVQEIQQATAAHIRSATTLRPLNEAAPLARSHGTRYPIVQGPMTRVSDVPAFALRVAEGGALPFLALALLPAAEVRTLLQETQRLLGKRPWGVGILGFVPVDLRQEQLEVVRAFRPPYALIAGGRPDQARLLEQDGIPTYLHVPSPGLLRMFLESGARRFVFEGRECGGHVGPRSSFSLWNTMIDVLLESLPVSQMGDCHVLFAGGIHDALSAAMVATMAAPLAERGARIGVLLGTAYLFTEEAVATGAIVRGFQQEAIRCTQTALLETGPGHATRCVHTPYVGMFEQEKRQLSTDGRSAEEIRNALEELNLGRLRIASKGIKRHAQYGQDPLAPKFVAMGAEEQRAEGMYMIGQVAALRDRTLTIGELHREVAVLASERLAQLVEPEGDGLSVQRKELSCDIAIIGMACLMPKAEDLPTYWENVLNKVDAITEVPGDRWNWQLYYDQDPKARDKIYSKWGGFMDPIPFDPTRYGMPPNSLPSIEPLQLLTLEVVRQALEDAGYTDRAFPRERTSVILGAGGGPADLGLRYSFRSALPTFTNDISAGVLSRLPEWTEDSFAGILTNVAAGRVANRFNLGGANYTVDAACAASLAAVYLATRELEAGTSDMVIVGGADTLQSPFAYLCFSKTYALSPRGRCRTFDESADGIVISEGVAILVLKRLADAERDGDRIYAVIKGTGSSSDGRDKGLTAPRPEGQARALERAYAQSGISPRTVCLIEAHGTGTVAGDRAEVETLKRVFNAAGASRRSCAIGSVKSLIGHTKCTAGVAGLTKVALALYHKVLPPTIGVEKPNPALAESPFYVNTEARPWVQGTEEHPRRAGVSAFGFGGTNFHVVLEEYTGDFLAASQAAASQRWSSELLLWAGTSRQEIMADIERLGHTLGEGAKPRLHDLAYTLWLRAKDRPRPEGQPECRLAVVATSLDDLKLKVISAQEALRRPGTIQLQDPRGLYFTEKPLAREGRVAFLFPGQGSQYPDMLCQLAIQFPEVRARFELADRALHQHFPRPLSAYIFPPPRFSREEEQSCQQALTQTNIAQPALGAADMALFHLLGALGVTPDMVAGHSYGEYVALCAAGVFGEKVLYALSEARGRFIIEEAKGDIGTMAAVEAGRKVVVEALQSVEGVWTANLNGPRQTIISGTRTGVAEAVRRLEARDIRTRPVPVACAFHSPLMAPARDRLAALLSSIAFAEPRLEVFSNSTAAPYPREPQAMASLLCEHLVQPIEFTNEIEAMYGSGARIFVEVGPRTVLIGLTQQILEGRGILAVALDVPGRSGILQLHHALGQLAAHGVPIHLDRLFQGRAVRRLNLESLVEETLERPLPPTTWLVDGSRARPVQGGTGQKVSTGPLKREQAMSHGKDLPPTDVTSRSSSTPAPPVAAGDPRALPTPEALHQPREFPVRIPEPLAPVQPHMGLPVSSPAYSDGEAGHIMLEFQRLMSRFLETQQQVMLAYLGGSGNGGPSPSHVSSPTEALGDSVGPALALPPSQPLPPAPPPLLQVAAQPSSPPHDMDNTVPAPQAPARSEPKSGGEPQTVLGRDQLTRQLLLIVSERTGYPPEMLGLDMNIEADLGIDSIKRVEILGALQRACLPSGWAQAQTAMEALTKLKTLRGIIDWIVTNALGPQPGNGKERPLPDLQGVTKASAILQEGHDEGTVPRFLSVAVDAPLGESPQE